MKQTVGKALRKGLAAVLLHQPYDPINYLANFLLHYNHNQRRYAARKDLEREAELIRMEEAAAATAEEVHCDTKSKYSYFVE